MAITTKISEQEWLAGRIDEYPLEFRGSDLPKMKAIAGIDTAAKACNNLGSGLKFDGGKPEYGLIPPLAQEEMVRVLTFGAKKYARENWRLVSEGERRYFDAMLRHVWAWKQGEENDPESGLSHLGHAMCCLAFLYEVSRPK